jgi:hypothetical protein
MSALRNLRATFQPRRPRLLSPAIETLNQRTLPSAGMGQALAGHVAEVRHERDSEQNGTVVKSPNFYEDYVGPRLAQLDVVKATGTLLRNRSFHFVGVNQGAINLNVRATYVIGVDRSGHLLAGSFPGRPNIRFDATIAIKIVPGQATTVTVTDLAKKTSTTLQNPDVQVSGRKIGVEIAGSLLPSTGLTPSHYRYNFWPEDGLAGSANIASFAPEAHDIPVGVEH